MSNLNQVKIKEKQTTYKERYFEELSQDIQLIKSLLISVLGKDTEGIYQPQFVQEILTARKEKPHKKFVDSSSFLKELQKV